MGTHTCSYAIQENYSLVRFSPESIVVQVGEAADILSGGKLRSTLHAMSRPSSLTNISHETFVVFLQPSWDKTLTYSGYLFDPEDGSSDGREMSIRSDESEGSCHKDEAKRRDAICRFFSVDHKAVLWWWWHPTE
jgi:hypothetical protein